MPAAWFSVTSKLKGIWSPMPTPLERDGNIDKEGIRNLVDFLIDGGIDGLFPLGTSGEFALLTHEKRKLVTDTVVDCANGRVPVFVGVSDPSTENIRIFSLDAKDAGVDGVVATPPYYYTTTDEALYKHFKLISEEVDLPLMIYNIPEWTHVFVPHDVVKRLAEEQLIVGMKYTEYNFFNLVRFISETRDKIAIFTGSDALAYSNLEFGGSGAVIGTANVAPRIAAKIFDEYQTGNLESARRAQVGLMPIIMAISVGKFPAGLKEAMNLIGIPVGRPNEPLPVLSSEEVEIVKHYLRQAGIRIRKSRR
jgi:4-hydroxy-tetrahydrodipicolinate synthase